MKNLFHFNNFSGNQFVFKEFPNAEKEQISKDPYSEAMDSVSKETNQAIDKFSLEVKWAANYPVKIKEKLKDPEIDNDFTKIPAIWMLENLEKIDLIQLFLFETDTNTFEVDFHGNELAQHLIGFGDLSPHNEEYIKISQDGGLTFRFGRRYTRPDGKIGFADKDGYIAILDGYIIDTAPVTQGEIDEQNQQGTWNSYAPLNYKSDKEEQEAQTAWREEKKEFETKLIFIEERSQEILNGDLGLDEIDLENVSKEAYIKGAKKIALEVQDKLGIPWQVTVAQSALESGWGKYLKGNAYFGIKTHNWKGKSQVFSSAEVYNGVKKQYDSSFRAYNSTLEAFVNYGEFLNRNPRYSKAFEYKDNPEQFIQEVAKAGYATDPDYAKKVLKIMKEIE